MAYQSEIEKLQRRYDEKPEQWFAALADAHRKAGEIGEALIIVRSGITERPNYVSGHIVLGRCLVDEGSDDEAEQAFQGVLGLDAENIIALKSLGEIAERKGDIAAARRWLDRLLEVDPMNDEARASLERLEAVPARPDSEAVAEESPPSPPVAAVEESPLSVAGDGAAPPVPPTPAAPTPTVQEVAITETPTTEVEPPVVGMVEGMEPTAYEAEPLEPSPAPGFGQGGFVVQKGSGPFDDTTEDVLERPLAFDDVLPSGDGAPEINELDLSGRGTWMKAPAEEAPGQDVRPEADTAEMEEVKLPLLGADEPGAPPPEASSVPPAGAGTDDEITERFPAVTEEAIRRSGAQAAGVEAPEHPAADLVDVVWTAPGEAEAASAEPELVVTETMAEVYVRQGLLEQARSVYRELVAANPANQALRGRLDDVEQRIAEQRAAAPAAGGGQPQRFAARHTGGVSVRAMLTELLAARPSGTVVAAPQAPRRISRPAQPSPMEEAFGAGDESGGTARPGGEGVSLASVFGDESRSDPSSAAGGGGVADAPEAASGEGLSFDEFFGSPKQTDGPPPSGSASDDEDRPDDEAFKAWLRGLKT